MHRLRKLIYHLDKINVGLYQFLGILDLEWVLDARLIDKRRIRVLSETFLLKAFLLHYEEFLLLYIPLSEILYQICFLIGLILDGFLIYPKSKISGQFVE